MKNRTKTKATKILSLVLSLVMIISIFPMSVFADEPITEGLWTINNDTEKNSGTATFSDIGFTYYSPTTILTYGSSGGKNYVKSNNTNGSASNGIVVTEGKSYCDFTPAKDGTLTVYVGNATTKTGFVSRKNVETSATEAVGSFVPGGDPVDDENFKVTQGTTWATVEVEVVAGYTYYITLSGSKMLCYGAEFVPYTNVNGTVTDTTETFNENNYTIKFTNKETKAVTETTVTDGSYSVFLKPNYNYSASLSAEFAINYAFSNETRNINVLQEDSQSANLNIENNISYVVNGKIEGFDETYDLSDAKFVFVPADTTSYEDIDATVDMADKSNITYSANLIANMEYTLKLDGAYDYKIANDVVVNNSTSDAIQKDVTVSKVDTFKVTGKFLGLTGVRGEYETLNVTPTSISFTNVEDNYSYEGEVLSNGTYSVNLRNGSYISSIVSDDYSTTTHVIVSNGAVNRDLLLKDLTNTTIEYKDTLYVGADKEYKTVNSAINAVNKMTRNNNERVVIKLDPGTYREQVVIDAPNVTLESNGGNKDDTKITGYYGIGYKYYSSVNSYYDPYAEYDKFSKGDIVSHWGATVITNKTATGFRAKDITFENSFNKYMTEEEVTDGVESNGLQAINVVRKENTNVDTKLATERAAAYVNYADQTEFLNCGFIGSQDTLYTSNATTDAYYKNCYIEGQTDFIFGNGDVIFDGCEINFCGYDGSEAVGYITANSSSDTALATNGYIFRSCYVSYDDERMTVPGYLGRMWGNSAKVSFLNTSVEDKDMIVGEGWLNMSVAPTDPRVTLKEYNTNYNGTKVDVSKRVAGAVNEITSSDYSVESVFINNGYTPFYYTTDSQSAPEFESNPTMLSNGDLNMPNPGETITASYTLGEQWKNNDASRISWYAVDENYNNESLDKILESATLLKTNSSVNTNKFQIPMACAGKYIMVVVTPITNNGLTGSPKYYIDTEKTVSDTWIDPNNDGGIAPGTGVNIYLAGDSTVKDYSINGMYNNGSIIKEGAWGEFLQYFFNEDFVKINNYAQGGRSSRSFINESKLNNIMKNIKEDDYLFIQFGHNDSANGAGYYEERFTPLYTPENPKTENGYPTVIPTESMKTKTPDAYKATYGDTYYAWNCGATYKGYIQQYIDSALEKGAIPVIVSPVARLYYNSDGTIKPHHDSTMTDYEPTLGYLTSNNAYVTACEELYEENKDKGVLYLDGYGLTSSLYEKAYKDGGNDTNGLAIMSVGDKTHSNKTGGVIQAGMIAKWIQDANISISDKVLQPTTVYGENPDGENIFTIKNKIFTAKDSRYVQSDYWTTYGQNLFDSLTKAEQPAPSDFTLTFTDNNDGTFTATIPSLDNAVYSFDGINYSDNNTKTDCLPNTSYTGYVKFKSKPGFSESPVTSNTQVTPNVEIPEDSYTLTVNAKAGGTVSGSGIYKKGEIINITATPDNNYTFSGWSSNNGGVFDNKSSASTTFEMPDKNVTITASFTRVSSGSGSSSGGSSITKKPIESDNKNTTNTTNYEEVKITLNNNDFEIIVEQVKKDDVSALSSQLEKEINNSLLDKTLVNVSVSNNGKTVNNIEKSVPISFDLKGIDLTDSDKETLTAIQINPVTNEIIYLGGHFTDDNTFVTDTKSVDGEFAVIVANRDDYNQIELQINNSDYKINGNEDKLDATPVIKDGTTYVPLRVVSEGLLATVTYEPTTKTATIVVDGNSFDFSPLKQLNNSVSPIIVNNRMLIPIRYVSESLGANVNWFENTKTVQITKTK